MDVDQIEAFLAIVETGGFTRAAARLHRSQPAISRRLGLLEAELGAPLLERLPGAIQLTDVGRAFLPHAEAMLAALRDGGRAIRDQLGEEAADVSLAVVGTVVDRPLAQTLHQFSAQRGRGRLKVLTTTSGMISNLVRRGEATLGLRYFPDDHPDFACRHVGDEPMVVVAASDRARRRRRSRSAHDWAGERWIGFPLRNPKEDFGRILRVQLAAAGAADAEIMDVDSLSAQKRLVEAGFGLALLPRSAVGEEVRSGNLKILTAPGLSTSLPVVLMHRRHAYLSPAAHALLELLASVWAAPGAKRASLRRRGTRASGAR